MKRVILTTVTVLLTVQLVVALEFGALLAVNQLFGHHHSASAESTQSSRDKHSHQETQLRIVVAAEKQLSGVWTILPTAQQLSQVNSCALKNPELSQETASNIVFACIQQAQP